MNKTTEALKLAEEAANRVIETLEYLKTIGIHPDSLAPAIRAEKKALAAIREARAEQERQEPVAWPIDRNWFYSVLRYAENNPDYFDDVAPDCISLESNEADTVIDALNAASVSAKREWVDLTDDELKAALDALENLITYDYHGNPDNGRDIAGAEAIAALRQAISVAEQPSNMNLNCKSVQARLATSWGYVKEQPVEQEPMAFADKYGNLYSVAGKLALELECLLLDTEDLSVVSKWWDSAHDALEQWRSIKDTAPVERQWVDLTDDELLAALVEIDASTVRLPIGFKLFARAVIAAFKEKNK